MPDYKHTGLEVVGLHIPDYSLEPSPDGNKRSVELPGKYQVGVVIEGVFKPLAEFKAAGLFSDIERTRQAEQASKTNTAGSAPDVAQPQQSGTGVDQPAQG